MQIDSPGALQSRGENKETRGRQNQPLQPFPSGLRIPACQVTP